MSAEPAVVDCRNVEARIAGELARLALPRRVAGRLIPPAPYVRRHAIEHAAAGGVLDSQFISLDFLPFVDAARLRGLSVGAVAATGLQIRAVALMKVWRQVAHGWEWESPNANANANANASALAFWAACAGLPLVRGPSRISGHTVSQRTGLLPNSPGGQPGSLWPVGYPSCSGAAKP